MTWYGSIVLNRTKQFITIKKLAQALERWSQWFNTSDNAQALVIALKYSEGAQVLATKSSRFLRFVFEYF